MNLDKIVFPTDLSETSRQALGHALWLAEDFDAELHMLHALVLHDGGLMQDHQVFPDGPSLMARLEEVAKSELGKLSQNARAKPLRIVEAVRRDVSAGAAILRYLDDVDADLVVMGTHGHRGAARLFLGSVAAEVVRSARCPVLTLRREPEGRSLEGLDRLLVPVDFSDHSVAAIAAARNLAHRWGAALDLIHVVEIDTLPTFYGPGAVIDVRPRLEQRSAEELQRLIEEKAGPEVEVHYTVAVGRAGAEIVRHAEETGADLIIQPTHGRTGIARMLLGSTAERVLRTAHCPVMTLKPFGKPIFQEAAEAAKKAEPVPEAVT